MLLLIVIKTKIESNNSGITTCNWIPFISIASYIKKIIDAKTNNNLNNLVCLLLKIIFPRISATINITIQNIIILVYKYLTTVAENR